MTLEELLARQIISLAWIRCLQEEGVDFVNKQTNKIEGDERVILDSFEKKLGQFDVPSAKTSRNGLEKNILEIYGSYCLKNDDPEVLCILISQEFKEHIKYKISQIKDGDTQ